MICPHCHKPINILELYKLEKELLEEMAIKRNKKEWICHPCETDDGTEIFTTAWSGSGDYYTSFI